MKLTLLLAVVWRAAETEAFLPASSLPQVTRARYFSRSVVARWASSSSQPDARSSSVQEAEARLDVWAHTWYPLAFEDTTDPTQPQRCEILGTRVVFWQGAAGQWFAAVDECPHRLAPLSEGRVVDGSLECPYHGWQFEGAGGGCVAIPQLESEAADDDDDDAGAGSRRRAEALRGQARLRSLPVAVRQGIIFAYAAPLFALANDGHSEV